MKILVFNGSPKGAEKSITMGLTKQFLEGMRESRPDVECEILHIQEMNIDHCRGCASCWRTRTGKCVIDDDAGKIIPKYVAADVVIWSFPLYIYGAPSKTKACIDRVIFPCLLPDIYMDCDGIIRHPWRYPELIDQRQVLISSCGFPEIRPNYDGLFSQLDIVSRRVTRIVCAGTMAMRLPSYAEKAAAYSELMKAAGREYAINGELTIQTAQKIETVISDIDKYIDDFNGYFASL